MNSVLLCVVLATGVLSGELTWQPSGRLSKRTSQSQPGSTCRNPSTDTSQKKSYLLWSDGRRSSIAASTKLS
jgi:hypothetical protein